ncbi:hypothetical protein QSV34_00115 [Porticoccus sp. W117]|uniref:hypothetical protein n=1 Tax=Porticoccus sp. W117 TaxID=3054777 RepID=UPI00259654F9|nr:hypothetical protein [Porticoccus sp. W117]MDM3869745.1 hypothetical protein [Porticoccus sp. W117]
MKQFVPITDEMFYNNPQLFEQLVPFSHSIDCRHLLQQPLAEPFQADNRIDTDEAIGEASCHSH